MIFHGLPFTGAIVEHTSDASSALWHLKRAALPPCSIGYCQLLARSVLTAYWPWVIKIAIALDRKGQLERGEVRALLADMHVDSSAVA